jgi:hypothetical protein
MPNIYSRDPWARTFIDIEIAATAAYLDDSYRSFKYPVFNIYIIKKETVG